MFYFPFDWTFIVRRTLNLVKPRLFIMMETEIWPNLLRECRARGVKTVMINGRISSRSYPRYRLVRPFFRRVLADVDRFCMQSEESARRLIDLGADPARVIVTGSLKFDSLRDAGADRRTASRASACCASSGCRPTARCSSPAARCAAKKPRCCARSRASRRRCRARSRFSRRASPSGSAKSSGSRARPGSSPRGDRELPIDAEPRADVVVLDTIGELAQLYQLATAVFVGGSLVDHGGHNILEPAIFGKPIVFGPHMQNFKEIADAFLAQRRGRPGAVGPRARGGAARRS